MRLASPRLALPLLLTLIPLGGARAQLAVPDTFTNLKVLPKDISKEQLLTVMRGFAGGLGVRCDYCHAEKKGQAPASAAAPGEPEVAPGAPGGRPPQLDFASDDKKEKRIARGMLRMVLDVNGKYIQHIAELADTASIPRVEVHCVTCHHGVALPMTLTDVLARDVAQKGVPAALAHYQQLKTEYYGSGAYDFREGSLEGLATRLSAENRPDDALASLALAAQEFPQSGTVPFLQGEVLLKKGDKAGALAAYQRAVQLDPRNPMARRRLTELQGQ